MRKPHGEYDAAVFSAAPSVSEVPEQQVQALIKLRNLHDREPQRERMRAFDRSSGQLGKHSWETGDAGQKVVIERC